MELKLLKKRVRIQKINLKNKDLRAVLIMFFVICLFFTPVFLKGWVIFPDLLNRYRPWREVIPDIPIKYSELKSDYIDGQFPYLKITKDFIMSGKLPLWNDHADLGKPFLSNINVALFPLNIFIWLFPIDIGFTMTIIIKLLLGSLGSYFWLRKLKISRVVSVLCSIVFVFSGFNNSWLFDNAATTNLFTPWVFVLIDKIYENKRTRDMLVNMLFLSLTLAFLLMAGFISGVGYVIYLSSFYILVLVICELLRKKSLSFREFYLTIKPGLFVLFSITLAIGISSVFLFTAIELVNFIDVGYRKVSNAKEYLPIRSALQLAFPNYLGNPVFGNWHGYSNWNETSSYLTIILLSIIPYSVVKLVQKKTVKTILIFFLSIFCILMIWKITPLLNLVSKLPLFDSSSSIRLLGLLTFSLVTLAAWGLNFIFKKENLRFAVVSIVICLVCSLSLAIYKGIPLLKKGILTVTILNPEVFSVFSIIIGILFLFSFLILLYHWQKGCVSTKAFSIFLGIILVLDIAYFSFGQTPMVPRSYFYPDTEIIEYLSDNIDDGKILVFDGQFMISGSQLFYGLDSALTHNMHTEREKEIVALFSEEVWASPVAPMLKSEYTDFTSPVFEFYGVKYIVVDPSVEIEEDSWKLVLDNQREGRIYENLEYDESKYWITFDNNILTSEEEFFENIKDVSNKKLSYIEGVESTYKSKIQDKVNIEIITDKADFNEIKICTNSPAILNVRENYWPGWRATINGEEVDILRVNYIYRGVLLKPGCNVVIEEFKPESFRLGSIISIISISVVFLLGGTLFFFDRSKGKPLIEKRKFQKLKN